MSQTPPRIEELDPNFLSSSPASSGLRWIDAFDRQALALRGLGWPEVNDATNTFYRLPESAAKRVPEPVANLSRLPAGVFLSFASDSASLSVRVAFVERHPMAHMPHSGCAGVELYLKEGLRWVPIATGIPEDMDPTFERQLFQGLPRARREYRLYLPPYQWLKSVSLGFEAEAEVVPLPVPEGVKPLFIYGTSITQGGCASTAGSDFPSLLGRLLDTEVINFGFSGNGKGEPEVAELIAEVDVEMYLLDFAANCPVELFPERLPRFVEVLREKRPGIPVVLITHPGYNGALVDRERFQVIRAKRDIMLSYYSRQREAGDENIHLIDGFGLVPSGETGTYVDGVHPTSGGFVQMAERIAPQLAAIRAWQKEWINL